MGSHFTEKWDDVDCVDEAILAHVWSSAQKHPLTSPSGDPGTKEMPNYI